ncbi:MAG: S-adenosylmethionine:tRNA ribosyltransferase-isomerase [Butyricicoccaceae bacterium]
MKKSDFYFDLPERLIAQHPLEQRDASRMMVLDRKDGSVTHRHFHDMLEYVKPGDCVVFNNSRVIPAPSDGPRSRSCDADRGAAA